MNGDKEKYGVIVCSSCRTAKIVDLNDETSECHKCGERLTLKKMKIHYRTDSRKEASWVIGRLNAKMRGGELPEQEENEEENDPYLKASEKAEVASDEKERLQIISSILSEELESFEISDVEEVYELLGREDVEDVEKKLKRLDEVYEPKEGVFSRV